MKGFKYFLDSNIFLRPIVKDNLSRVRDCENLIRNINKGKFKAFTSNLVLAEIVWVGSSIYKIKKIDVIRALNGILNIKNLKILDKLNISLALELYEDYNIKFIDALIASNARIFNKEVIIVSYDKDFDKIGIERVEPREIR